MKLLVLCVSLLMLVEQGLASCDIFSGPPGTVKRIRILSYLNQYQWATCLSDTYIKQKSLYRHKCRSSLVTFCWYQCMIEIHNKESGQVSSDCSCNPSQGVFPSTSLPSECYSPSGDSCDWYRNCLERKYPCKATSNAYAIAYAEKFCRLYGNYKSWFTEKGQKWVDGVRKCLQVSLVPLLRPWRNPTCWQIRTSAFASQHSCYLNPDKNVTSVCELDCKEYFKIFFLIKGAFLEFDTAWESMKRLWNVECAGKCARAWLQGKGRQIMKVVRIDILRQKRSNQAGSSDLLSDEDARSRFAYRLGSAIAYSMAWNKELMDWLTYPGNTIIYPTYSSRTSKQSSSFDIFIIFVDKNGLGIIEKAGNNTVVPVNFDNKTQTLASTIKEGKLNQLQIDGYNVWLKSIASCFDKSCEQAKTLAVSDKPPKWYNNAVKVSISTMKVLVLTAFSFMLVNKP